ncbi:hypothetical protein ACSC9U_17035 [Pseudomonas solani]|uniref:hypothetical protein n=1 Tax=Pseudomonas solani TaxID=2731552 RepID=UPI003F4ADC10
MIELQRVIIHQGLSLRELLARMDQGGAEILLLVDGSGRLVRTVTDGDLRRLLLAGTALEEVQFELPEKTPITVQDGTDREAGSRSDEAK